MKNKFILLFILIIFLFISFMPFREGFSDLDVNDPYKYLAPVPVGNTWSQTTMNDFANKFNTVNNITGPMSVQPNADQLKNYIQNMLEEEAQHYIQYGKYFLNSYITDYLKKNPVVQNGETLSVDKIATMAPNRLVYAQVLSRTESTQSPQPLSYQIYKGIVPPPTTPVTTPTSQPPPPPTTTPGKTDTNNSTQTTNTNQNSGNITNNLNKLSSNCHTVTSKDVCEKSISARGNKCYWSNSTKSKGSLCYSSLSD